MSAISFNEPVVLKEHPEYLLRALASKFLSGMGPLTASCQEYLDRLNGSKNLVVTSATHALEMMALLLEIAPGDEVILPSFTFVSTANAFVLRGAQLRFADNDEFGNISLSEVERLTTKKTRAVVAVHYAGNSCRMDRLRAHCDAAGIRLLEDAAQAIGSKCDGRPLGTIGDLGCYSFHETKNIGAGEGGALIVNELRYLERADIIRQKGTNRSQFLLGMTDKYTWVDVGSSYVLSELNASYLLPQLEQFEKISEKRKHLWERYYSGLAGLCESKGVRILVAPEYNEPNRHIFALIFDTRALRDRFIVAMREERIGTPFHYIPLHSSPFGQRVSSGRPEDLVNCEDISAGLVRLPLFYNLTQEQQDIVIEKVSHWIKRNA